MLYVRELVVRVTFCIRKEEVQNIMLYFVGIVFMFCISTTTSSCYNRVSSLFPPLFQNYCVASEFYLRSMDVCS